MVVLLRCLVLVLSFFCVGVAVVVAVVIAVAVAGVVGGAAVCVLSSLAHTIVYLFNGPSDPCF